MNVRVVIGASAPKPQELVLASSHSAGTVVICAGSSLGREREGLTALGDCRDGTGCVESGEDERQLHLLSPGQYSVLLKVMLLVE